MCESKVVLVKGNEKTIIMEDVTKIEVIDEYLRLFGLLGEYKEIKGRVIGMNLVDHEILVEGESD